MAKLLRFSQIQWASIAMITLLTACASSDSLVDKRAIEKWGMKSRIAIVYPEKDCATEICKQQSDQGRLQWSQDGTRTSMSVLDPFGKKLFSYDGDDQSGEAFVDGQMQSISDVRGFFKSRLKMDVAPASLRYWLIGRVDPSYEVSRKSDEVFVQNGVTIEAKYWREESVGNVPSLINIEKDNYKIRVVVREWFK